jgi:hypothetical protein
MMMTAAPVVPVSLARMSTTTGTPEKVVTVSSRAMV